MDVAMLRNLSRILPQQGPSGPKLGPSEVLELRKARDRALSDRTEADRRLRQAEADLRGARAASPDITQGESWRLRPAAWAQAAPHSLLAGPKSGTEVAPGLSLFHDAKVDEVLVRQSLCDADAPAPFTLSLDTLHFDGAFLSLCLHLSTDAAQTLTQQDLLSVTLDAKMEAALPIYARLNLVQQPNTRDMLAQFPFGDRLEGRTEVVFELAYANLSLAPVSAAWVDLIFEKPAMNAVHLRDLLLVCKKRAEL